MARSILNTTKKSLGLAEANTDFDTDILMFVNSVLANLTQLGIGPKTGLTITDAAPTWEEFLGTDPRYNMALEYMYYGVRIAFDPPASPPALMSMEKLRDELAWRLSIAPDEPSANLLVEEMSLVGDTGDTHTLRLRDTSGTNLISEDGSYAAEFVSSSGATTPVTLDTSEVADGVLILPVVIKDGTYVVRLLEPRRTLFKIKVDAQ